jgi:hypothetical protein
MTISATHSCANRTERGYALLFVLFLMALVIIGASTAVLDQLTEGRREKEAEMIWRGKEYQRAIGRYYHKFGRFPTSIDDLVKVQNGEERFLREAYKNPMNAEDGTWRFIYVTPGGQLIGSVQYTSLQQMALVDQQRQMGLMNGSGANGTAADNSDNGSGSDATPQGAGSTALTNIPPGGVSSNGSSNISSLQSQLQGLSSQQLQAFASEFQGYSSNFSLPQGFQAQLQGLSPQQLQALAAQFQGQIPPQLQGQLQQLLQQVQGQNSQSQSGQTPNANGGLAVNESSDTDSTDSNGEVVGGFIVGVAGKQNKPSIKVYKGGTTYKRWEFIFNPLEQVQTIGGLSAAPTSPVGSQPNGQTPFSNQFQLPQMPQQQPQNPQQQQQQP